MSLAIKIIHLSRYVIFHEHIFPVNLISVEHAFPSTVKTTYSNDHVYSDCGTHENLVNDHTNDSVTHSTSPLNSVPTHLSSSLPKPYISLMDFYSTK